MSAAWLYLTAPKRDEAEAIGRALVEERLAACVNVLGEMRSFYRWEGKIQDSGEVAFVVKTRRELVDAVTARVKQLHSDSCPCVVALPVEGGNADFLAWIERETAVGPADH